MQEPCFSTGHPHPVLRLAGARAIELKLSRRRVLTSAWALACVLASLSAGTLADQTYYRWTDDRGNLVMSDRPPDRADIEYETIAAQGSSLRRPRKSPAPAPAAAGTSSDASSAPQPATAPKVAAVERDPELCEQARKNLEVLTMKPRIRIYNEQGELEYLTPGQIEEEKRKTRLTIEEHCRG